MRFNLKCLTIWVWFFLWFFFLLIDVILTNWWINVRVCWVFNVWNWFRFIVTKFWLLFILFETVTYLLVHNPMLLYNGFAYLSTLIIVTSTTVLNCSIKLSHIINKLLICYLAYFFFIIASIILKWEAANSYIILDFYLLDFSFLLTGPTALIFYFYFYFDVSSFAF